MKYRSEIDGLRAVAVISVVIFHFFPNILPSGYLGVDIFFVISGYLITIHLIKLNNNSYKKLLREFYTRRIKRLFPALFIFFVFTSLVLSFLFLKSDFKSYFSSLIAAKTFWANWFFWQDGGYFGGRNDLKPLLHIWSLSVEEQFYLFYPSFIFISLWIYKLINLKTIYQVALITFFSFILWIYLHKIGGSNPAFFLLPTRSWQFGLGGFIALLSTRYFLKYKIYYSLIFIFSVFLVIFPLVSSYFRLENSVLKTIFITFGTALFLYTSYYHSDKKIIFFSNPLAVWLGKISYSVYLYHWPIAVILIYYYIESEFIPLSISFLGIILSFFLGYLSFTFIETPFRKKFNFKYTIILLLSCTIINIGIFNYVEKNKQLTLADSFSSSSGDHFRCNTTSFFYYGSHRSCYLNKEKKLDNTVALIGNSHAQMYGSLFSKVLKENNRSGILISVTGCLPTVTINLNQKCLKKAREILELVSSDPMIKHVFLSLTWTHSKYVDNDGQVKTGQEELIDSLFNLTDYLIKSDKIVSIISPIPSPKKNLPNILPRMLKFKIISKKDFYEKISIDRKEFENKFSKINYELSRKYGHNFIKVYEDICDDELCYFGNKKVFYFADNTHLANEAINLFTKTLIQVKKNLD